MLQRQMLADQLDCIPPGTILPWGETLEISVALNSGSSDLTLGRRY